MRDPGCKKRETPIDLAQFGAVGPKGDQGDKGDPGVIATAFAAFRYDTDTAGMPVILPSDSSFGDVMDLNTGGRHSGALTVGMPARLIL